MKKTLTTLTFTVLLAACSPETKVQLVPSGAPAPVEETAQKNNTIEGTVNGGGGKGVLCTKNGQETLEILDLYEGRALYELKYSSKYASLDEAMKAATEKYLQYIQWGGGQSSYH